MYKIYSQSLPIDCMGIILVNPSIGKDPHYKHCEPLQRRYLPYYIQVHEIFTELYPSTITQPDWVLRGTYQKMSWPSKPLFFMDDKGPHYLWVNAHPSENVVVPDFKIQDAIWAYGYQDNLCSYLMQITEGIPRGFKTPPNVNSLVYKPESLDNTLILY